MNCYHDLYMSDQVAKEKETILNRIEKNQWQMEIYLITLSKGEQNHLDIFNSVLLIQKTFSKEDLFVVGIARGYEEALNLVEKITQEVYDNTGTTNIRKYILQKQKDFLERNV